MKMSDEDYIAGAQDQRAAMRRGEVARLEAQVSRYRAALRDMVEEFKKVDLPYGSSAYDRATDLLRDE